MKSVIAWFRAREINDSVALPHIEDLRPRTAFWRVLIAVFPALVSGHLAQAQALRSGGNEPLDGEWRGTYICGQGVAGVTLTLSAGTGDASNTYTGRFSFYPPRSSAPGESGEFQGILREDPLRRQAFFEPRVWIKQPPGYVMSGFAARIGGHRDRMYGVIHYPGCRGISVQRVSPAPPSTVASIPEVTLPVRVPDAAGNLGTPNALPTAGTSRSLKAPPAPSFEGIWDGATYPDVYHADGGQRLTLELSRQGGKVWIGDAPAAPLYAIIGTEAYSGQIVFSTVQSQEGGEFQVTFYSDFRFSMMRDAAGNEVLRPLAVKYMGHVFAAYLFRRVPGFNIPAGVSLQSWCSKSGGGWLQDRLGAADAARSLKTRYFDELSNYFEYRAGLVAIFSDEDFARRFGKPVAEFDDAAFDLIMEGVRLCALTDPDFAAFAKRDIFHDILDDAGITYERHNMLPPFSWSPRPHGPLMHRADALAIAQATKEAESRFLPIMAALPSPPSMADIRSAFQTNAGIIRDVRPAVLDSALAAIQDRLNASRNEVAQGIAAQRHQTAAQRMAGIEIPDPFIPVERRPVVHAVANGDVPGATLEDRTYLAGMASEGIEVCSIPMSSDEQGTLASLVQEASGRTSLGNNYSDSVSAGMRSQASHITQFAEGSESVRAIGCTNPFVAAFMSDLADYLKASRQEADTGLPLFVRSCAQERSRDDCECIARLAETVMSDVYGQPYSSDIIRTVVARNPIVALQMGVQCHVGNY